MKQHKLQLHILIIMVLLLCGIIQNSKASSEQNNDNNVNEKSDFRIIFNTTLLIIGMKEEIKTFVKFNVLTDRVDLQNNLTIRFYCENEDICNSLDEEFEVNGKSWEGYSTIKGAFIGRSRLCASLEFPNKTTVQILSECQNIIVMKKYGIADTVFGICIGIIVFMIYISFGACLEIDSIKEILLKPIGPIIGLSCQFILMPIISFALGYILFINDVNMWLGLFFCGVIPGGGASNMWTIVLKGNVNLSIVMTTISNLAAFIMMPAWIFTLGKIIFDRGNLGVPYTRITYISVSLMIPLLIGLALQKFKPKVANTLTRLLKPVSIVMLVVLITFGIFTNYYIFKAFSWKIVLAGMGLPWFGYVLSYIVAWILRQNKADCLTISIETGLQNTGIAIFLLQFSLDQPEADLTSLIPISVSLMTKIPLLTLYLIQRFCCKSRENENDEINNNKDKDKEKEFSLNSKEEESFISKPNEMI